MGMILPKTSCSYLPNVNKQFTSISLDFGWIQMASNSNSSWLEAYEAQKAKALQRIESKKNGENVTGLSGISGVVDSKEVSGFSKKTQVTKLLSNLKKPEQPKAQKRESQSTTLPENKPEKIPKMSLNNSLHQAIDDQKLASIQAFQSNPASSNRSTTKTRGMYTQITMYRVQVHPK